MDPRGKGALITGAASGIGRASALALAARGARVVVADIDEEGGAETVRLIKDAGGEAWFVRTDVTRAADLEAAIRFTEEEAGGLYILHNNAGILPGKPGYPDVDRSVWERILAVNLWPVVAATQMAIGVMKGRGGVIVSTSSLAGLVRYDDDPVYSASKHGIVGLTRSLAGLGKTLGIRVNAICPAGVDTPMVAVDMSKMTQEEIAEREALLERVPLLEPERIAEAVMRFVDDDTAAGKVMLMTPGREFEIVPAPVSFR